MGKQREREREREREMKKERTQGKKTSFSFPSLLQKQEGLPLRSSTKEKEVQGKEEMKRSVCCLRTVPWLTKFVSLKGQLMKVRWKREKRANIECLKAVDICVCTLKRCRFYMD